MSARATFWAWEQITTSSEKLVLLCLADCHNGDTGQCNPSVAYVSRKTHLDRKTVLACMKSLNAKELLSRSKVSGSSNNYFLSIGSTNIGTGVVPKTVQGGVPNLGHKPKREPKKNLRYEDGDMNIAKSIFNLIRNINPKHKEPKFDVWANDVRLMREQDNRSHHDILALFKYANSDDFWKSNILSPKKLRDKWDVLTIKKGDIKTKATEVWI